MFTVTHSALRKHVFLQHGGRVLLGVSVFTFLPSCPFGGIKVHKQAAHRWLRAEFERPLNNKIKFEKRRRGKKTHPVLPGAPLVKGYGAVTLK